MGLKSFLATFWRQNFPMLGRDPMYESPRIRTPFHGAAIGLTALISVVACLTACLPGCSGISEGGSFLSDIPAVQRYERKFVTRPDGSRLECFLSRTRSSEALPLVFFCQGSGYASQFEEMPMGGYFDVNGWVFERPEGRQEVRFAFVEKRGVRFGSPPKNPDDDDLPEEFLKHDTCENRVSDILWALDALCMDPKVDPTRVALLGHGEGAPLAAAAAVRSPHVTHLGYFSAGGQTRLVELLYLKRLELRAEGLDAEEVEEKMDDFFSEMEGIFEYPDDYTCVYLGTTPLHINSCGFRPPLEILLELEIPIFVAAGSTNPVVPMASTDLIRLGFMRYGKENLTYRVYPGLNHGFMSPDPDNPNGPPLFQFPMVFDEFCAWMME